MCSIAGTTQIRDIQKLIDIQQHRGPDADGCVTFDDSFALGMGRLKIIDLASDNLCPRSEGDVTLSYNGEVYNYIELRAELQALGWVFETSSDTEVVLKSWQQWGTDCFLKFNGMFAIAVYDKTKETLTFARDIAGEKPLYYYHRGKTFAFASEAKALRTLYQPNSREDTFFEAFQHCRGETLWEDIYELLPAHYAVYDLKKHTLNVHEYWHFTPQTIRLQNVENELEELLEDAVNIRTRSDVPYGLYYSGGVDSSLISTFHPFNHQFYFDDTKDWQDAFSETFDKIAYHIDFPVGSLSCFPLWHLASEAKPHVTVILSGEGADELFGGYARYMPAASHYTVNQHFPSYTGLFRKYLQHDYLDGFARITARNDNVEFVRETLKPYFEMFDDPINAMGFADFKLIMPSLLQMGDRMSSAHSLENRCPFLDRRLIEFAFSLPPDYKISHVEQKLLLRRLLEKRGLTDPLKMEKKGLTVQYNKWHGSGGWDRSHYFEQFKERWKQQHSS